MDSTTSPPPQPSWILKDPGSFASIHVKLPTGTRVHCESDAIVSFSDGVQVRGVLTGGLMGALARFFFTQESFFTTAAENVGMGVADVMMAPSEPGGIVLHRLTGSREDELLLTSGAYVASDSNVKVASEIQSGIGNSLMSGTGFFLLKATGQGYVACGAYGAVHKYVLRPGETRAVDNGHLVAWSASMNYSVRLAAKRGIYNSVTSGEGLMCYFDGPGTVYLQSHKPGLQLHRALPSSTHRRPSCLGIVVSLVVFFTVASVILSIAYVQIQEQEKIFQGQYDYSNAPYESKQRRPQGAPTYAPRNQNGGDYRAQREF